MVVINYEIDGVEFIEIFNGIMLRVTDSQDRMFNDMAMAAFYINMVKQTSSRYKHRTLYYLNVV